jgi:hypothetical protein
MPNSLFIATEPFNPSDGAAWEKYIEWAKIPHLKEVVGLDMSLCSRVVKDIRDEDWAHIVIENFRSYYFRNLDYLLKRAGKTTRNILGLYRNPETHIIEPPGDGDFQFLGYELIDEGVQISALTNCGGFPETFSNDELNEYGLISSFVRANQIRDELLKNNPEEPHADCEMYALWRLREKRLIGDLSEIQFPLTPPTPATAQSSQYAATKSAASTPPNDPPPASPQIDAPPNSQ